MAKIKRSDVDRFERVQAQIAELHKEIALLAKGKSDGPLNPFKVSIINERLRAANQILTGDHRPFESFTEFEDGSLPSNSDATVVLSQYLDALEGWRSAHVMLIAGSWYWELDKGTVETEPPSRGVSRYRG